VAGPTAFMSGNKVPVSDLILALGWIVMAGRLVYVAELKVNVFD
jgi:hypothetical protein